MKNKGQSSDTILEGSISTTRYYSTGQLAPEKVIVVVPLEQVRKEGSRVSFHCEPHWIGIVQYCVVDI